MQKIMGRRAKNSLLSGLTVALCFFLAACGGGGGSSGGSNTVDSAPAEDPVFVPPAGISANITKIDTSACPELSVYVSVSNEKSQTVLDLNAQNFQLLEDGILQDPTSFSFENIITESIVFSMAMDYSLSLTDQDLLKIEEAASNFITELFRVTSSNQLDNWGEIVKFGKDYEVIQSLTNDEDALLSGIDAPSQLRLNSQIHTGLYDAVGNSINRLIAFRNKPPTDIPERSIVIVITDGKNNDSVEYTKEENIASAKAGGIQLITIGIGTNVDGQSLYDLAIGTDGLYFYVPTPDDLITIFTQFLENMKDQYVLKYNTGNSGSANMVEVIVETPDGTGSDALAYACP
jgi:hypothetical protein